MADALVGGSITVQSVNPKMQVTKDELTLARERLQKGEELVSVLRNLTDMHEKIDEASRIEITINRSSAGTVVSCVCETTKPGERHERLGGNAGSWAGEFFMNLGNDLRKLMLSRLKTDITVTQGELSKLWGQQEY